MKKVNVIFMGTPDFSVPVLEKLIKNCNVIAVVTQPDKIIGKDKLPSFNPIKRVAFKNNIKVIQPVKIKTEYQSILDLNPDIIITCAYGQIIPKIILDKPKYGCINVHASILPKLRGGAPIHRAIIDGYSETGITIMYMDEGMDTGDIISCKKINISKEDTVGVLHDKLSLLGANLLIETLPDIIEGNIKRIKQNGDEATFAKTIKKEDELIDFNDLSNNIYNKIRGLNPWPGGYIILKGNIIKLYESKIGDVINDKEAIITNVYKDGIGIGTKDNEIIITKIKPNGKKMMSVKDYLNGIKDKKELIGVKVNE